MHILVFNGSSLAYLATLIRHSKNEYSIYTRYELTLSLTKIENNSKLFGLNKR